jgi:hypothetical protein
MAIKYPVTAKNRERPFLCQQPAEITGLNPRISGQNHPKSPVLTPKCTFFPVNSLKAGKPNRLRSAQRQAAQNLPDIAKD